MKYVTLTSAKSDLDFEKEANKALSDVKKNIKSLCKNLLDSLPDSIEDIDEESSSNITDIGNSFRTKLSLVSELIGNCKRMSDGISRVEKEKKKIKDKKKLSQYDEILDMKKEEGKLMIRSITKAIKG